MGYSSSGAKAGWVKNVLCENKRTALIQMEKNSFRHKGYAFQRGEQWCFNLERGRRAQQLICVVIAAA